MGDRSPIQWCDSTLSLWHGCTQISPACDHCYAMRIAHRLKVKWNGPPRVAAESAWAKIESYQRGATRFLAQHGHSRRVFINHLSDFFDKLANQAWRDRACAGMENAPDVIFILVTKRPQNVHKMVPGHWVGGRWPKNIWLLVTGENDVEYRRRVAHLSVLQAVGRITVAGVSIEPMLERFSLRDGLVPLNIAANILAHGMFSPGLEKLRPLNWFIFGGESGAGARSYDENGAAVMIAQARHHGAAVFSKQLSQADHPKTYEDFDAFPAALRIREFPA